MIKSMINKRLHQWKLVQPYFFLYRNLLVSCGTPRISKANSWCVSRWACTYYALISKENRFISSVALVLTLVFKKSSMVTGSSSCRLTTIFG